MDNVTFNFLRTGNYGRSSGYIYRRTQTSYWWLSANNSSADVGSLVVSSEKLLQNIILRGEGIAIRCVIREG